MCKGFGIRNVRGINLVKQDDDDTDRNISGDISEDPGESTVSCNIDGDNLNNN
jgi:hypothetical protein